MTFFENMTVFEKITLFMCVLMVIMCIVQAVEIIVWHKKVKKIENKIKIKHRKTGSYICILVALANIAVESYLLLDSIPTYNYNSKANGYLYMIIMWFAFLVFIFLPTAFVRRHYITPDGLFVLGADMYKSKDVKYKINGDNLEIKSTAIPPALDGGLRLTRNVKSSIL